VQEAVAEEVAVGEVVVEAAVVAVEDVANFKSMKNIPFLGVGIGFRPELKPFIFLNRDKINFVEIIADHYIDVPKEKLHELILLKNYFTVIPHAINLSIGSAEGIDVDYLHKLKMLIDFIDPPYWSEHISYTKAHGIDIGHLSPIVFNDEFLDVISNNIKEIKKIIRQPLILENITYHVELPGRNYDDASFLNALCERSGCGLLLDVTNLYINSCNLKFDPLEFVDKLNLNNIIQLHFVGFEKSEGQIIDTHSTKTPPEIFNLMNYLFKRYKPKGILLERDDQFEKQDEIREDLIHANDIFKTQEYVY
jgi:uncharacterized protein (UPF0276 family)